jgi:formylglycine-generating enzyme required for sulfatase activity
MPRNSPHPGSTRGPHCYLVGSVVILCIGCGYPSSVQQADWDQLRQGAKAPPPVAELAPLPAAEIPEASTQPLEQRLVAVPEGLTIRTNSIGMRLVTLPAGQFMMGSPSSDTEARPDEVPQINVTIAEPFAIGQTEVTRGQFRQFVTDKGYRTVAEQSGGGFAYNAKTQRLEPNPQGSWQYTGFDQTDEHPVINVSTIDAEAFCQWLSEKEGVPYRLPSEEEWEYACRAGTTSKWNTGDDIDSLKQSSNLCDASLERVYPFATWCVDWNDGSAFTTPVASYRPNAFGLFDMHGNVFEWCTSEWPTRGYDGRPLSDPDEEVTPGSRIVRGGSFLSLTMFTRSADRVGLAPDLRNCIVGFRVVQPKPATGSQPAQVQQTSPLRQSRLANSRPLGSRSEKTFAAATQPTRTRGSTSIGDATTAERSHR